MRGRPMREYVVLPAELLEDAAAVRDWTARALAHAAALPPKADKKPAAPKVSEDTPPPKKRPGRERPGPDCLTN